MARSELEQSILQTLENILRVKEKMDRACDQTEIRRLQLRLKELQYLQIWQMEKLERMSD
ncbi:MAG: hypothetical protein ACOX4Q_13445 [Syntrophomonadales bacterium]|jgi:hypothetical protein